MTDEDVKTQILEFVASSRTALKQATPKESTKVITFNNHPPFGLTASTDAIKSRFYKRLNGLQGSENTFRTGGTWT